MNFPYIRPFPSAPNLQDWITKVQPELCQDYVVPKILEVDSHRGDLPDSVGIRFAHGNFQPSNIIVSTTRPYRVVGLVNWGETGWMPTYWEGSKASYKSLLVNDWETGLAKLFGEERDEKVHIAWSWYIENFHSF